MPRRRNGSCWGLSRTDPRCITGASARSRTPKLERALRSCPSRDLHRAHELKVVVVRIGERGDPHVLAFVRLIGLLHHACPSSPELFELALHIPFLDVPDHTPRFSVLPLDLIVRANGHRATAELPSEIAALVPGRLTEKLRVIVPQPRGILRADQQAVQVHFLPFPRRAMLVAARFHLPMRLESLDPNVAGGGDAFERTSASRCQRSSVT